MRLKIVVLVTIHFVWMMGAAAQSGPVLAAAGTTSSKGKNAYPWTIATGLVCGMGASESFGAAKPTAQCGGLFRGGFLQVEAGVMGPQIRQSAMSGYFSVDAWVPIFAVNKLTKSNRTPYFLGGYTRMFETGHALDYGIGYGVPLDANHAVLFEVKDYWVPSQATQHELVLRVSWVLGSDYD